MIVLSQNPHKTRALYQVGAIHRLNPFLIIYRMMRASIFISGGGGLLQDSSGKGYSILYYGGLLFFARLLKIPSMIYAQGIGPIKKSINKKLLKWILPKVNLITVRDEQSKDILKELGINDHSITVNADPSFLLKEEEIPEDITIKYKLNQQEMSEKKIIIGIVIRNCSEIEQDYHRKVMQFAEIADYLIENYQANLFFIPFQYFSDHTFMREIIEKMKFASFVNCIEEELHPGQILSLYSKFTFIIGMRFHSILFAAMMDKPFIAINYDPKVRYFVYSLELPELLIDLSQISVKNIDFKLQYIIANRKRIQSILNEKKEQFKQKALMNTQQFYQFIVQNILVRKEF